MDLDVCEVDAIDICEYKKCLLALVLLRSMGDSQFILDVTDYGYRIPFHCIPPVSFSISNISRHWRIPIL